MGGRAVIGVDIGTSSSKGVLVSLDGSVVGRADRAHAVRHPFPGQVEHDATVWWDEFASIARELIGAHPELDIVAVGVSGMGPCLVVADEAGRPLRPAILYGVDTRATEQIARLEAHLQAHPADRDAWLVLGAEWFLSGRTRKAADVFLRLSDRAPDPALAAFLAATEGDHERR